MKKCFILKDNYNKKDYMGNFCDYCKYCEILDYQAEEVEDIFGECEEKIIPIRYCNYHDDFIENLEC